MASTRELQYVLLRDGVGFQELRHKDDDACEVAYGYRDAPLLTQGTGKAAEVAIRTDEKDEPLAYG